MADYATLKQAVIEGNAAKVKELTQGALDAGDAPQSLLDEALIQAMDVVGEKFANREFFIPEMLIAARAMQAGLGLLKPLLAAGESRSKGKVVIGTVKGDLHDIGKNLVGMMLQGAGFEVVDLGADVKPAKGPRSGSVAEAWQREPPRIALAPDPAKGAPVVEGDTFRLSGSASVAPSAARGTERRGARGRPRRLGPRPDRRGDRRHARAAPRGGGARARRPRGAARAAGRGAAPAGAADPLRPLQRGGRVPGLALPPLRRLRLLSVRTGGHSARGA
jgi:hypothetical protein